MSTPGNAINESTTGICGFNGTAFVGTAVTVHNVLLGGATSSALTNVAPSSTAGIPLVSNGSSSDPSFTTAVVAGGGTGRATLTAHGVLVGNGTTAITQLATGSSGQVLQSGGASADPAYSTATYPSTATSTGVILRANGTNWVATTATYPTTTTVSQILYSSSANVIGGITTGNNGVLITSASGVPSILADGTTGQVLTATTGSPPSWVNASGGSPTINGDSGSITGSTVTIYANNTGNNCGSSVKFTNSGTTSTFNVSDGNSNTIVGFNAGNSSLTASNCAFFGNFSGQDITSGNRNIGVGRYTLGSLLSGSDNIALGDSAMFGCTGSQNVGIGTTVMNNSCSGTGNVLIGYSVGEFMTGSASNNVVIGGNAYDNSSPSGSQNVILGYGAGFNYTGSESGNIIIGYDNSGTAAESNVTRIGNAGTQGKCFIDGITGKTVTGTAVLCSSTGQLGTISSSKRYKENIDDIPASISVLNLTPKKFNYIKDETKAIHYGLIAEEVEKDFPYLCFYNDQGQPESVLYHELPTLLLKEIQRLNKRIMALESTKGKI